MLSSLALSDTKRLVVDFLMIVFENIFCSRNENLSIRGKTRTENSERVTIHLSLREFNKTTTAAATGASLNKRFNEQNNGCARAL